MEKNNEFIIVGYAGHSYVCLDNALLNSYKPLGYFDLKEQVNNPYHLEYLGSEDGPILSAPKFISIGDNSIRRRLFEKLKSRDQNLDINLIHPKSIVSSTTTIGINTLVSAGAIINSFSKIGNSCIINTGAIIEHEAQIEDYCHIAPGAVLAGNVKIGKGTFIGANSVIKQGLTIGDNVIVGAGSVILQNIPDNTTIVGNPGKSIKK